MTIGIDLLRKDKGGDPEAPNLPVEGLGSQGLGFRGLGCRGLGFRVPGVYKFRVWGSYRASC